MNKLQKMDENQQELIFKLSMYEQQIRNLQQQLEAVEKGILDMNNLNLGLDELIGSKDKEILAPIGRGIFVKTKLLSEELTVDVGDKNFVKKGIPDTKKIITEQIKKLEEIKKELNDSLDSLSQEMTSMINGIQEENSI